MIKTKAILVSFLVTVVAVAAATARAQSSGLTNTGRDPAELVVGDWYDVTIERHQVKQETDGMLVKITDDWVVLGKVVEACYEEKAGVPYLRDAPLIGGLFSKTIRHAMMWKNYVWIPRDAVHVDKEQAVPSKAVKMEFKNDAPALAGECEAYLIDKNGGRASDACEYLGMGDGHVVFNRWNRESVLVPAPKWSHVPIIGALLATPDWVERKVETRVPLEDVLYLVTEVRLTPEQIKLASASVTEQTR
jgi:hypothetical protein